MSWCCVSSPGVSLHSAESGVLTNSIHLDTEWKIQLETGDALHFTYSKELKIAWGAVLVKQSMPLPTEVSYIPITECPNAVFLLLPYTIYKYLLLLFIKDILLNYFL